MSFSLQSVLAHRAQSSTAVTANRNRSDSSIVHKSETKAEATMVWAGSKLGEALIGMGFGYMVAMGEPRLLTDAAEPGSGWGLIPVLTAGFNAAELASIWFGFTPSRKVGGGAGLFLDGMLSGAAGASNAIFWFNQGNVLGLAKGGAGTPGVSTLGLYDHEPHMMGAGSHGGYAPAVDPTAQASAKVQAARAAGNDPHSFYF